MVFEFELATCPGPRTLFLVEMRLERHQRNAYDAWMLWLTWWMFRPKYWRDWLWDYESSDDGTWRVWKVRFLGFEFCWQRRR